MRVTNLVMSQPPSSSGQLMLSTCKLKQLGVLHWEEMREGLARILDGPKIGASNGNVVSGTKWSARFYGHLSNTGLQTIFPNAQNTWIPFPSLRFHGPNIEIMTYFAELKSSGSKSLGKPCLLEVMGPSRFACHFMILHIGVCFLRQMTKTFHRGVAKKSPQEAVEREVLKNLGKWP